MSKGAVPDLRVCTLPRSTNNLTSKPPTGSAGEQQLQPQLSDAQSLPDAKRYRQLHGLFHSYKSHKICMRPPHGATGSAGKRGS